MPHENSDAPTQRIQRPEPTRAIPRLPDGLNPARSHTGRVDDDATDVLSLDELMELAAEPQTQPRPAPPQAAPPTVTHATPPRPAPPQPAQPARPARPAKPARTGPSPASLLAQRVRADASRAGQLTWERSRAWLTTGDNGLIAATAFVTLLLIVIVAVL